MIIDKIKSATIDKIVNTVKVIITGASGYNADVDSSNQLKVAAAITSSTLPTGAATAALQTAGNASLVQIDTNTDPLVTSGGGGYVRQDSTGTIAKETGGNLATIAGKDFATQTTLATLALETGGHLEEAADHLHNIESVNGIKKIVDELPAGTQLIGNVKIKEVAPDDTTAYNPSVALTWTGSELTQIEKTVGATTKTRTITWTSGVITAVSVWS